MLAAAFFEFGEPEVLGLTEVVDPRPDSHEVLVRIHGATVNPTDTMRRSGAVAEMRCVPPPYVVGMEFAGTVDEVSAEDSGRFRVGDHVMGLVLPRGSRGAYAGKIALPASHLMTVPSGMKLMEAATLPMNGLTALIAVESLGLPPGSIVGVTGAAGVLGGYVTQLAKAAGLTVVADASPDDEDLVRRLGADVILPRQDFAAVLLERFPAGVAGVVDCAVLDEAVSPAVSDGGIVVTLRHFAGSVERRIRWRPIRVRNRIGDEAPRHRLERIIHAGTLTTRPVFPVPPTQAAEAHRRMEAGGLRGRLVLDFASA